VTLLLTGSAIGQEKINFRLDWVVQPPHAYFIAAKHLGHYRQAGLDVDIHRGHGSADTIKGVAAGAADFGFADAGSLVVARAKGMKAKEVGMIYDKAMYELHCLKKWGIRNPKDLEGKIMGTNQATSVYVLFPAFAATTGLDLAKVQWSFMTPGAIPPSIVAGKVHCGFNYATVWPIVKHSAAKGGEEAVSISYADHGVDIYSNGLIATDERLATKSDQLRAFVHATMKGVAWVVENPGEGVKVLLQYEPALDPLVAKEGLEIGLNHLLTEDSKRLGLGHMTKEKMERTRDIVTQHMKLEVKVPVEDLYTNDFLPRLFPKRGKM
jgi:NitT/TauT family transport system substrate-binding protein